LRGLVKHLLSEDVSARRAAIESLRNQFGYDLNYDPEGEVGDRRKAALEWSQALE
jgi:hypothetical protein